MRHPIGSNKRHWLAALLLAACLLLTACSGVPIREQTAVSLPTASVPYIAPIGDAALEYTAQATMYLPRFGSKRLQSISEPVAFSASRMEAESVIRALLAYAGNGMVGSLGGEVKLSLFGANPVEVSGDVATVNLAASALQLERETLYLCAQAFANTLTEYDGIRYVNLLVMDKQIGLDLGSTLPAGALTRSLAGDVGAQYEQALAQRVQAGEDPAAKRLNATVALYFPLATTNGVMSEARNLTFTSQQPQEMAIKLLQELGKGPATVQDSPALPLLAELLAAPPEIDEPEGGGGRVITLHFDSTLYDMLAAMAVPRASCFASITYTLCTFLPNMTGVTLYVGEDRIDHVMLGATDGILFENGIQRRANYAPYLMDDAALYFADATGERLALTRRPVPFHLRCNPREVLLMLLRGVSAEDMPAGAQALLPVATLTDADILGISLIDGALVVNLSDTFRTAGEGISAQQERLLAYGLVDSLLCGDWATRVYFFVGGKPFEGFSGTTDWTGPFYENRGLAGQR